MSDIHGALNLLALAGTRGGVHGLLDRDHVLLSPRVERIINEGINDTIRSGDLATATDLVGIRDALREIRRARKFTLPDVPGARIASDLIQELSAPTSRSPLPAGALDSAFIAVLSALKIHVKKLRLRGGRAELHRLDRRIAAAGGLSKRTARARPSILALLERWLDARSWSGSYSFWKAHEGLTGDEVPDILAVLLHGAQARDDEANRRRLEQHIKIVAAAGTGGQEELYRALIDAERHDKRRDYMDDHLMAWLSVSREFDASSARAAAVREDNARQLSILADVLAAPMTEKGKLHIPLLTGALAPADVRRAQELYWRVVARGGKGSQKAQHALLEAIAVSADLSSIAFWQDCLSFQQKGDQMIRSRPPTAIAALALLAIEHDDVSPVQALLALLSNDLPFLRALAVDRLGQVYLIKNAPLPPEMRRVMEGVARADRMTTARWNARAILKINGLAVPHDHAGEVYRLDIWSSGARDMRRVIEIRSEQTLEDLHRAIQKAIGWRAGEPYSFDVSISGNKRDSIYSPGSAKGVFYATEWRIGDLGLDLRSFLFYQTGAERHVGIMVRDISESTDTGVYPRVVDSEG